MELVFNKVTNPLGHGPLTSKERSLLLIAGYNKDSTTKLIASFQKISENYDETSDIFWQWNEESVHWEIKHSEYVTKFRSNLGLTDGNRSRRRTKPPC